MWLRTKDLADRCGVSMRTAQRWARSMGAVRLGRRIVTRAELISWLCERRQARPDLVARLRGLV
jgi:phage terminase Nu1 subunit (DNA packaging protein)